MRLRPRLAEALRGSQLFDQATRERQGLQLAAIEHRERFSGGIGEPPVDAYRVDRGGPGFDVPAIAGCHTFLTTRLGLDCIVVPEAVGKARVEEAGVLPVEFLTAVLGV